VYMSTKAEPRIDDAGIAQMRRAPEYNAELVSDDLKNVVQRISAASVVEIDRLWPISRRCGNTSRTKVDGSNA